MANQQRKQDPLFKRTSEKIMLK